MNQEFLKSLIKEAVPDIFSYQCYDAAVHPFDEPSILFAHGGIHYEIRIVKTVLIFSHFGLNVISTIDIAKPDTNPAEWLKAEKHEFHKKMIT